MRVERTKERLPKADPAPHLSLERRASDSLELLSVELLLNHPMTKSVAKES